MLINSQTEAKMTYEIGVPTAFEENVFIHVMFLRSRKVGKKNWSIFRNGMNSIFAGIAALFACAGGFGCDHEVLFAWRMTGCHGAIRVVHLCCDTVSGSIAAIGRPCVAETRRTPF